MRHHQHKFRAIPTVRNGIRFDSKKEAAFYDQLCLEQKWGSVLFVLRQVPFDLPGGLKYKCDFQVFYSNGHVEFIDVKGYRTKEYIMKKKMVESLYPITIQER